MRLSRRRCQTRPTTGDDSYRNTQPPNATVTDAAGRARPDSGSRDARQPSASTTWIRDAHQARKVSPSSRPPPFDVSHRPPRNLPPSDGTRVPMLAYRSVAVPTGKEAHAGIRLQSRCPMSAYAGSSQRATPHEHAELTAPPPGMPIPRYRWIGSKTLKGCPSLVAVPATQPCPEARCERHGDVRAYASMAHDLES